MRTFVFTAALAAPLMFSAPAPADDASDRDALTIIIRAQHDAIAALEARITELEARTEPAHVNSDSAVQRLAPPPPAQAASRSVSHSRNAVVFGRIQADAWSSSDNVDGTEVRRARMGMRGNITNGLSYVIDVDFAGQSAALQDAILDRRLGDAWTLRLGYHKVPFSLDDQTSDNYNLFMEHPAGIAPFTPGRAVGVATTFAGDDIFLHVGVFGEADNNARDGVIDENVTVGGRAVWAPGHGSNAMFHLGAAVFRTWTRDDSSTLRLRARPERNLSAYVIDTGTLDADALSAVGLEAAVNIGQFGAASEVTWASLNLPSGDDTYAGGSIETWWTLTGEHRPYKMNGGVFNRISPNNPVTNGGIGAWQVAARFSALNLANGAPTAGELSVAAVALNWHWSERMRLMFDANRATRTTPGGVKTVDDGFGARMQIDW